MPFISTDGHAVNKNEEEAYFVYKPYPKKHFGIEYKKMTPKFKWSSSAMNRIMKRKRLN